MKLQLKYFASVREALGTSGETIDSNASTIAALKVELLARGEPYTATLAHPSVRVALNHAMSHDEAALKDGDEVAFFPPVTGG